MVVKYMLSIGISTQLAAAQRVFALMTCARGDQRLLTGEAARASSVFSHGSNAGWRAHFPGRIIGSKGGKVPSVDGIFSIPRKSHGLGDAT